MMEPGTELCPLHGRFEIKIVENMDKYSDEVFLKKVEELKDIEDFEEELESCKECQDLYEERSLMLGIWD